MGQEDYFGNIYAALRAGKGINDPLVQTYYDAVRGEILSNKGRPLKEISFGTSGWRGILGKDINIYTVSVVTCAIIEMYRELASSGLADLLGVADFTEVQKRGCVLGFDNRFGGEILASAVASVLTEAGIKIHYAGESTTGVLSAVVLKLGAAFSINLTPSHNPLEYGGYKFNGADAGPAPKEITAVITEKSRRIVGEGRNFVFDKNILKNEDLSTGCIKIDSLELWRAFVAENADKHFLDTERLAERIAAQDDFFMVLDSVHGASRMHTSRIFGKLPAEKLCLLRSEPDVSFGGIAPEPSSANLQQVVKKLSESNAVLKLGAIIDPDGDRIRFTDGETEITMNQFGAIAYHFLHEYRGVKGMVAKSVASSNLANGLAQHLGEEVFEPPVGFKEFKPVLGKAIVCFEESDGISVIGHTPEKDAYIGLLLAVDIVLTTGKNLGEYLREVESLCGAYYPKVESVLSSLQGKELLNKLSGLDKIKSGDIVQVSGVTKEIDSIIDLDGYKFVLEDGSWLLIRPSGTEPKIRLYVEARQESGRDGLLLLGREMLCSLGLLAV